MKQNADKCKILRSLFQKIPREFRPVFFEGKCLDVVESVKILGLTVNSRKIRTTHVEELVKKVTKRI